MRPSCHQVKRRWTSNQLFIWRSSDMTSLCRRKIRARFTLSLTNNQHLDFDFLPFFGHPMHWSDWKIKRFEFIFRAIFEFSTEWISISFSPLTQINFLRHKKLGLPFFPFNMYTNFILSNTYPMKCKRFGGYLCNSQASNYLLTCVFGLRLHQQTTQHDGVPFHDPAISLCTYFIDSFN